MKQTTNRLCRIFKISSVVILSFFIAGSMHAQEQTEFTRNGKWLVETGYNIVSGLTGGGTGANFLVNSDGDNLTSIGAELGKFTSENFAIKFRFGIFSSDGFTIKNVGVGGKYYLGGNVPLEFGAGLFDNEFDSQFQGTLGIGYAIPLADNVYLEPSLGVLITEEEVLINLRIGFAMIL